jgi:cellobiose phosphorylase
MYEMIIRPGKQVDAQVIYAAGKFDKQDAYVINQTGGKTPFGETLCFPGSEYHIEATPDGSGKSKLGRIQLTSAKAFYVKDQETGDLWSAFYNPVCSGADEYEVRYLPGQIQAYSLKNKIACILTITVSPEHDCELWHVRIENHSAQERSLKIATYIEPAADSPLEMRYLMQDKTLLMRRPLESIRSPKSKGMLPSLVLFHSSTLPAELCSIEKSEYIGSDRTLCNPMELEREEIDNSDGIAVKASAGLIMDIEVPIEGEAELGFCFGVAASADEAAEVARCFSRIEAVSDAVEASREHWIKLTSSLNIQTEDPILDSLVNTWLPYEAYAAWIKQHTESASPDLSTPADAIAGFLPIGANAAYQFREALINFAGRLSVNGTYHPDEFSQIEPGSYEVLWLAICTASYIAETGNIGVLSQTIAFKDGMILSLGEHCERAIRKCANEPVSSLDEYEALERALRLWSYIKPSDELTSLLEKVRNRKVSEPKEMPEQRNLPRRLQYLQSICPTLSQTGSTSENMSESRSLLNAYTTLVDNVFGLTATYEGLILEPKLPESWFECMITRRFRGDIYNIHIKRSANETKKGLAIVVDGEPVLGNMIPFFADGKEHHVESTYSP